MSDATVIQPKSPKLVKWIGAYLKKEDVLAMSRWLDQHDIPAFKDVEPHCTLIYTVHKEGINALGKYDKPISAKHIGWKINQKKPEDDLTKVKGILVMQLESEGLEARHKEEMKVEGTTWDFPSLGPHISLAGEMDQHALDELLKRGAMPLYNKLIYFDREEGEVFEEK